MRKIKQGDLYWDLDDGIVVIVDKFGNYLALHGKKLFKFRPNFVLMYIGTIKNWGG